MGKGAHRRPENLQRVTDNLEKIFGEKDPKEFQTGKKYTKPLDVQGVDSDKSDKGKIDIVE